PGHNLKHAAGSGRRNIGLSGLVESAPDRRPAVFPALLDPGDCPLKRKILPQLQRCPLLGVAFALLPPRRRFPCPAGLPEFVSERMGLARPLMLLWLLAAAPVLEAAIFDAGNVGLRPGSARSGR